ncbi:MAG TPA: outer membrane protein assembly factor BamD [Azonexus sp.]|jgi:outer membrane protein assembly factor BamD|nr:outer membrane protein assembly factor BamD [Azonexus sp.]
MMRSVAAFSPVFRLLAALSIALLVTGCGLLTDSKDETAGWSANKIYDEARAAQSDGAWDKAAKYYEKLEARYPYGRYAQQAQLELGYVYWKAGEAGSAIAAADRFIKLHPNHPTVDYAYYLKGLVNFNEDLGWAGYVSTQDPTERDPKAARASFDAFRELATRFPDSKYTPDAIQRMNYLVNALASHEVHVARYYLNRGAYVAAANRAQYEIKTYPTAPATEEAMYILVLAYEKLGMTDLREDADRVMRKNFPDSKLYTEGLESRKRWWHLW